MTKPKAGAPVSSRFSAWCVACNPASRPFNSCAFPMATVRVISSSFSDRNCKVECCAFAELAIEPDAPTLHLNKALRDVQAQTGSGSFTSFRIFRAEEALEDLCLIFKADADSIVFHPKMHYIFCAFRIPLVRCCFGADNNLSAFRCVLMGVTDQIDQHLSHANAVRPDLR